MDVLCSDKTGTLTEARIKLVREVDLGGARQRHCHAARAAQRLLRDGLKSPLDEAILAARHVDLAAWRKIDEVPFDFERRRISVWSKARGGG